MAELEQRNARPVFGLKTGGGLFYYIFVLMLLFIVVMSPAHALANKNTECVLSSPQLIPAKAAIVVDAKMSVIYEKNPAAKLPPASTSKLVTAMVVLDRLDPGAKVKITPKAAKVRPSSPRLRANEELTVSDLLHLALMRSVNSAAVALAEAAAGSEELFAEIMNQKAQEVGAGNTRFANASGLPKGLQYTTVYDLTLILNEALKYPAIKEILGKKECSVVTSRGRRLFIRNTDRFLWATDSMIGGKTGYTRKAQHCFVGAMQTDDGPIFTAVLGTTSRNSLWRSTALLFSLGTGPQSIPAIKMIQVKEAKLKKGHKVRNLSKQRHEKRPIRLALKRP